MRDCRLQRLEAVIEGQERVLAKATMAASSSSDNTVDLGCLGPVGRYGYRSLPDRLCRCGAPMQNLAHSASFDSDDNDEPSKLGIKHPRQRQPQTKLGHAARPADERLLTDVQVPPLALHIRRTSASTANRVRRANFYAAYFAKTGQSFR